MGVVSSHAAPYLGCCTWSLRPPTLHKTGGGQITFDGVARAYHDTYDFNASAHRSEIGEKATAGGRQLDRIIKGTPYEIIIEGELPINIQR